jgi:hypothetical protein
VSVVEAILLSPRISDFFEQDGTRNKLEIVDSGICGGAIGDLLQFIRCEPVSISASRPKSLVLLARQLENLSLAQFFQSLRFESNSSLSTSIELNAVCSDILEGIDIGSMSIADLSMIEFCRLRDIVSSEDLRLKSEDWLLNLIISLGSDYTSLLDFVHFEFLSEEGLCAFFDHYGYCDVSETVWEGFVRRLRKQEDGKLRKRRFSGSGSTLDSQIDSTIISSIPSLFCNFGTNAYRLLYRGSRDGFDSKSLHGKVDGHSHTITLIETTKGFIFGAYAVCSWHSRDKWQGDESMESFLFTLKNPHGVSARTFRMKPTKTAYVIYGSSFIVWIGYCGAIGITASSPATGHNKGFGDSASTFENDTGLDGKTLFTGDESFTVKELEIFEFAR